jgi:putative pyruvate formate lyase activating enzyme
MERGNLVTSMDFLKLFERCQLCPRECGVNRLGEGLAGRKGFCKESHQLRVAYVGPHFGEEPPLSGINGSGTIFFTGCSLRCSFCQNQEISRDGLGETMGLEDLFGRVVDMIERAHVHNVNLVTPDHYFPHVFQLVFLLRSKGYDLPVVYNMSGYQSVPMLKMAEDFADIYMPDFKYGSPALSMKFSKCKDYPKVALEAISEMVRQKGFLNVVEDGLGVANKGVLVRHLILPGHLEDSFHVLDSLYLEFGAGLPLSLMSQYQPVPPQEEDMNRRLTQGEYYRAYSRALDLGFEHLFVQFPDRCALKGPDHSPFFPDFRASDPFSRRNTP